MEYSASYMHMKLYEKNSNNSIIMRKDCQMVLHESKKLLTRLNMTRLKRESIEWKKTFFSYMSDKELINRIYGELRN
jgi:hypothetical protein